jgi:hypothetical protein
MVLQVAQLAITGFRFLVHPDGFVVHRPHEKTRVQRMYVVALNDRARKHRAGQEVALASNFTDSSELDAKDVGALLQNRVNSVFMANQAAMKRNAYRPHIDVQTQNCLQALPWWQPDDVMHHHR